MPLYICLDKNKSIALYYYESFGRTRVYRKEYPLYTDTFILFKYEDKKCAEQLCSKINLLHKDCHFEVVNLTSIR